jgi:hypothetical protein
MNIPIFSSPGPTFLSFCQAPGQGGRGQVSSCQVDSGARGQEGANESHVFDGRFVENDDGLWDMIYIYIYYIYIYYIYIIYIYIES